MSTIATIPRAAPGSQTAPRSRACIVLGVRQPAPPRATRLVQAVDLRILVHSPDGRQRASRAYQGGTRALAAVTVEARIIDAHDAKVFDTAETLAPERFAKDRAADYFVQLPISRLNRGHYLFTISAASGQRTVRRDVRFDVR